MKKAPKTRPGTLKKVLRLLRPHLGLILLSLLLSALTVALTLYIPVLVGRAIDGILGPGKVDFARVGKLLGRVALVALLTALFQWLQAILNNRITYAVVEDVRNEAFRHLQRLPLRYLDAHPAGEVVSEIVADVDVFADGLLLGFTQLFSGVATILGTVGFMVSIQPGIAALVVLVTPLSFLVARFVATHSYRFFRAQSETRGEQTGYLGEMLTGQKVVKAFGREKANLAAFDEVNDRLADCSLKAIFYSSLTNPSTRFVNNLVYALVALSGALVAVSTAGTAAAFTVGSLSALLSYANQYTKPFNEISGVVTELQNALACADRVFALMEEPAETPDAPEAAELHDIAGQVELSDVTFCYTPDKPLIEHLSLAVHPGQRIAIVGPTGCGKTTLINLLMRFYDVLGGSIAVEGRDIRAVTRRSLRKNYGMVLQETWLKNATVRENLTMGRPEATEAELIAAAKAAHAHSFIKRLPQGYDTVLGEDGGALSQGQKQLLCIARIMLCLPPMLILDEATSSIDTRTEIHIQEAFAKMMSGRTTFIVAHRLSTVREADLILVMRDGHVVEQGSHDTLLAQNGFYATLYNSQFAE
ncbi:MAG: ABC transporter ATP-binding protein [bacterium]